MLIRTEAPVDILAVDRLLKSVFETDSEAELVMRLRENGRRTLSLVACNDDGEVVGYVMFSPVTLNDEELNWQALAPLAVKPEYRRQGIATELVKEGLIILTEFNYPACVVMGDLKFYGQFGFAPGQEYNLQSQRDTTSQGFHAIALTENELNERKGVVGFSPEFHSMS
ncbi:GNAT family N-acetyltransferase [Vibrio ostreicida]|uniref:GNAT family N-acetyltransferase n=1 Tax=Vibrio ostreicida TaxID=526588 RepID=UPI000970C704|nr:N-acetyltransferase [Vibrio ostreicida]